MALLTSLAALFLLAHFLSSTAGASTIATNGAISPKWTTDLRSAVGSDALGTVQGRKREWQGRPRTSLWFLDNETILATFITREVSKPSLSSRNSSDLNQPLRLRAVFLQAETGQVKSTQAWPSESRIAGVVAVIDGKFVTQTGVTLTLYSYSSDAREVKKLSLPALPEDVSSWHAHSSPTGRSILFEDSDWRTASPKSWILVNTDDLQIIRSWKEEQSGRVGISDSMIAMAACMFAEYHCDPNLKVKSLATEWRTIAQIQKSGWVWAPQFVNNDIVFLPYAPWELLKTDGKVVLTEADPKGGAPITSAGGQRFVVPFFKLVGKVESLDIGGHGELKNFSVYDAPFQKQSYKLEVKGAKIRSISNKSVAQLALSPDGSKLAVLYEESVYVFELPPAPPADHTDSVDPKNGNQREQVPVLVPAKPKP